MVDNVNNENLEKKRPLTSKDVNLRLGSLLADCADGNKSALEEIYHLTSAQLFGVLRRILNREALAEEALQETYTKVWVKAGQYDQTRAQPMVWLNRIARNQAIDLIRQRTTREDHEVNSDVDFNLDTDSFAAAVNTEKLVMDSNLMNYCLQQLQALPRQCVVAAYCEGFSHEELSERLQKPVGTVKSWIRRSLLALRKCIDDNG